MSALHQFTRTSLFVHPHQDRFEKIARVLLKPLRLACGREVKVTPAKDFIDQNQISKIARVFLGILALMIFPATLLGLLSSRLSKSHATLWKEYKSSKKVVIPVPPPPAPPLITIEKPVAPIATSVPITPTTAPPVVKIPEPITPTTAPPPVVQIPERPYVDIAPYIRPESKKLTALSRDAIIKSLDELANNWHCHSQAEINAAYKNGTGNDLMKKREADEEARANLNLQIFAFVKKEKGVATPRDFLISMQGFAPKPRHMGDDLPVDLEEGEKYEDSYGQPLQKIDYKKDGSYWGHFFKKENNQLKLYLDGGSQAMFFVINGAIYPYVCGRGANMPSYIFKEGDQVSSSDRYLFTVGKNGSIIYPCKDRSDLKQSEEAQNQSGRIWNMYKGIDNNNPYYTTNKRGFSVGLREKLAPGFALLSVAERDQTILDVEQDPIFKKLVVYLKAEFELMNYSDEQKMTRLAHFSAELLEKQTYLIGAHNYFLGELIYAGGGVCRHRAVFLKALCDELNIPCAMVGSHVNKTVPMYMGNTYMGSMEVFDSAGHMWNIMGKEGNLWIVDPMHHCMFPIANPPDQEILEYYGAKVLVIVDRKSLTDDSWVHP